MFEKMNREELVAMLNKVSEVLSVIRERGDLERECGNLSEAWAYETCAEKLEEILNIE